MTDGIVVLIFILVLFIVTAIHGEIEARRYKTMIDKMKDVKEINYANKSINRW